MRASWRMPSGGKAMHTLIVGSYGVGKSCLIEKILAACGRPAAGFLTKKEDALADELLGSPIYIYEAGKERRQSGENLLGYCKNQHTAPLPDAFERFASKLQRPADAGSLLLMDELGVMESKSPAFCQAVLELLDGDVPVLAAVKDKSTPFLEAVRAHPKAKCFYITKENREELYPEVLAFVQEQLEAKA